MTTYTVRVLDGEDQIHKECFDTYGKAARRAEHWAIELGTMHTEIPHGESTTFVVRTSQVSNLIKTLENASVYEMAKALKSVREGVFKNLERLVSLIGEERELEKRA